MAAQGIWSGTISFSLVAIPVRLITAVQSSRVSFRQLHDKDYSPLHRRMYCPRHEKIVEADEVARGFEIAPDKYVLVTDAELESVAPERSRSIDIEEFVDLKDVDALYYDKPYYLVPNKGGEKAYRLLVEVLAKSNKAGLAKFVLREREYPVAVKSTEGALTMVTLHYRDEIVDDEGIVPEAGEFKADEQNRMKKIIEGMAGDFNPNKFADERKKKILALIKKKTKSQKPVEPPEVEEEAEGEGPVDLVSVLEESMRRVKENRA